ncbi:iron-containing alcohol dehydrogenase [Mitsuokella sp. AF33-22]|uniref:iron-containing alcohol dehydrogenase n=1 Tax=Mitsuokella sp. AF33-22 TaxID=2292047 RepID=UPI000E5567A0|nr:iron-containing alcohol dehydrogenase [Mitsuokella sp. AF33-22]RHM56173.1 iron-containing alcohol dehydrogenase [Mitsuokella sp. AF33-22]
MEAFTFSYPTKNYFGQGAARKALAEELPKYGKHVLLAYGGGSVKRNGIYDELMAILKEQGREVTEFAGIMSNPTYRKVQEGVRLVREHKIDLILAVGGGSVSDCCKAVSAQAALGEDLYDYEYAKHKVPTAGVPMGVIVTASGTGSEQNAGAVITYEEKNWKGPLWGTAASFAVLDPYYTKTVPMRQVISGAFDTLSHCLETYLGTPREPNLSDVMNESVMRSVIENIRKVKADPEDMQARSELMWASAMAENGVLKLGKVTDFQCHMIEHQLGAYTDCNHGCGLAVIQPELYRHLAPEAPAQFARLAREVFGVAEQESELATALAGVEKFADFIEEIGLPTTLKAMGIEDKAVLHAVAATSIRTPGCAKKLTDEEIEDILLHVLG